MIIFFFFRIETYVNLNNRFSFVFCRKVFNASILQNFDLNQQFLIVITRKAQNITKPLNFVFGQMLSLGFLQAHILIGDTIFWSLHDYRPYRRDCLSFETFEIGRFTQENSTKTLDAYDTNLFPAKIFEFNNCTVKVSSISSDPYVIITESPNGTTEINGLDIVIINEVAQALNLIPKYLISKNRGKIFKNGTATDAIKMVYFCCQRVSNE